MNLKNKDIAIVCDWLIDFGGAELVLSHLLEIFPEADIYTSVCYMNHPMLEGRRVYTSWLQKVPFFNRHHKLAGILRPWAFRSFDLTKYDILISSCSAEAKHAGYTRRKLGAKHICYCHTPTRYYWSHAKEYENMLEFGRLNSIVKGIFRLVKGWMQKLDREAVDRVDFFIANSENTKARIQRYYHRDAVVIYPGANEPTIQSPIKKSDYYVAVGRCIPYKRFDLLIDTFHENGKKLIIITNTDTTLYRELKARSKSNIEWKFQISNEEKNTLMSSAQALLFPQEEDFGLVPIESMMVGTPVIAYASGGALETVEDGKTGIYFSPQTPSALMHAMERFESVKFDDITIRERGFNFSKERFQKKMVDFLSKEIE